MLFKVKLQQFNRFMAAFIDNHIFLKITPKSNERKEKSDKNTFVEQLSKSISGNADFLKRNLSQYKSQTFLQFNFDQREYMIELSTTKDSKNLVINIRKTSKVSYNKVNSKHFEILLLKDLAKRPQQNGSESTYFIQKGCINMTIKLYFQYLPSNKKLWVQYYSQIILKNFHKFHKFLQRTFQNHKQPINQYQISSQFHEDLHMVQTISSLAANFDISEEKSHFKSAQEALRKQKMRLNQVRSLIRIESQLQNTNHQLFHFFKNYSSSLSMSSKLIQSFEKMQTKGKRILTITKTTERKIQDFLFNVVKIQIKAKIPRPIAEGGSSYIYLLQALLTFVNSVDYTSYKRVEEKSEKLLAIKILKPQFEKRLKDKLLHQKQIVSKLKGSCSNFLPKYYGTDKDSSVGNDLLMEHLHGEQLDKYVGLRSQTISLWTKICLLLNIVHGMRHLGNYGIIHFDIKPINIIVCRFLQTKILDYGEAYHKDLCPKQYCPGYTFPYAAPQVYGRYADQFQKKNQKYFEFSQKQDVFAFGMIMYEVLFNDSAFKIPPEKLKKVYYEKEVYERLFTNFENLNLYGKDLIMSTLFNIIIKCLHPQPQNRPLFDWIGVSLKLILNSHKDHC